MEDFRRFEVRLLSIVSSSNYQTVVHFLPRSFIRVAKCSSRQNLNGAFLIMRPNFRVTRTDGDPTFISFALLAPHGAGISI